MANTFNPAKWGGETTSKDYELLMAGDTPISDPISLVGHAMTGFNQELKDPVTLPYVVKENGRIRNRVRTLRPAEEIAQTFTMLFGPALWTPALQRARLNQIDCRTTFYGRRLCPPNSQEGITYIFEEAILNPPKRVNDFITIDDTTMAEFSTEGRIERELILWAQGAFLVASDVGEETYAVTFDTEDCPSCSDGIYVNVDSAGGDGVAAGKLRYSSNRFGSNTAVGTSSIPAGSVGTSLYSEGDVRLAGFADDPDVTAGTTGGTVFSTDAFATTPTVDNSIAEPIYGVDKFNGQYIVVGGVGGAAAKIYVGTDGVTWTAVTSDQLPLTSALSAIAVDEEAGNFYVVGENGNVLKGSTSGGEIVLVSLTAPSAPGDLYAVHVFAKDHFAVGGAAGYYAESFDAGLTWVQPNVPGTATIKAIGGDQHRSVVGAATVFYVRSVDNKFNYTPVTLEDGKTISGNVTSIATPRNDPRNSLNYFLASTDTGEMIMFKPFHPNA